MLKVDKSVHKPLGDRRAASVQRRREISVNKHFHRSSCKAKRPLIHDGIFFLPIVENKTLLRREPRLFNQKSAIVSVYRSKESGWVEVIFNDSKVKIDREIPLELLLELDNLMSAIDVADDNRIII